MPISCSFVDPTLPPGAQSPTFVARPRARRRAPPDRTGRRDVRVGDLVQMFDAGMGIGDIVMATGLHPKNIRRRLRRIGRTFPRRERPPLGDERRFEQRRDAIYRLVGQGMKYPEMARRLGIQPKSVLAWVHRWLPDLVASILLVPDRSSPAWREKCRKAARARRHR